MSSQVIRQLYRDTDKYLNTEVTLSGWVRTVRDSKTLGFMEINDGTFFKGVQIVFEADKLDNFEEITKVSVGSAVEISGKVVESPAKGQKFEIQATEIKVVSLADSDFPLQKKRHTFEYLRTIAHLRPRTNTYSAVFRLRSVLAGAVHEFFQSRNYVYAHTPIISTSDCEGAGEMFQVTTLDLKNILKTKEGEIDFKKDFFSEKTGLAVSGQLNGEAFAHAFRDIYTFGPTFRAENSNTPRHASEFWMIEPEMAFCDIHGNMDLAEAFVKHLISVALEKLPEEIAFFDQFIDKGLIERLKGIVDSDFERITYTEAVELLEKSDEKFEFPVKWGLDLQSEHEQYICKKFGKPVFVIDYPAGIKAFYMHMNDPSTSSGRETVAAMDLLVPGVGEIIGGSQRENRLEVLDKRMVEMGLNPSDYDWYRDLRRFGGVEHAGFGLGFERMIQYISGMKNIRDVIPFPRVPRWAKF